jgi:hypothetical protein
MKKIVSFLTVICITLSLNVFAAAPVLNHKEGVYKDFINYNAPLTNTYKRLTKDRELNVVYFGGSVTAGFGATNEKGESSFETHSWRALVGEWFKENFPTATVRNYTAAIGGGALVVIVAVVVIILAKKKKK